MNPMNPYQGSDEEREELYQMLKSQYNGLANAESVDAAAERSREMKLMAGLAQAGDRIGSAIAGTKQDPSFYQNAMQMADDPVKQAERTQDRRRLLASALADKYDKNAQLAYQMRQDQIRNDLLAGDRSYKKEQDQIQNQFEQERLDIARKNASKTAGGQQVTAGTAKEVGEIDAAIKMAEQLEQSYQGKASGLGSGLMSYVPGADANLYDKERDVAAQTIGTILEGGKLTAEDYQRYKAMLPSPSDTNDQAATKMAAVKNLILEKKRGALSGLQASGFNVEGFGAVPESLPTTIKGGSEGKAMASDEKTVAKKQYSPSRNQTKVIYSDGTEEILDGKR